MEDRLTDLISDNPAVAAAIITAFVAVILFLFTRVFEFFSELANKRGTRKRIVIGLFQEVKYNLEQLKRSFDGAPPYPQIERMKEKNKT